MKRRHETRDASVQLAVVLYGNIGDARWHGKVGTGQTVVHVTRALAPTGGKSRSKDRLGCRHKDYLEFGEKPQRPRKGRSRSVEEAQPRARKLRSGQGVVQAMRLPVQRKLAAGLAGDELVECHALETLCRAERSRPHPYGAQD